MQELILVLTVVFMGQVVCMDQAESTVAFTDPAVFTDQVVCTDPVELTAAFMDPA
jgi:hypothetical protein